MNKKLTAIGLSAGLLAGVGAGYVLQNSGNASASISPAAVSTVATNSLTSVLAPLVSDGTITQAQADKVIAALQAAGVGAGVPMPGGMGGDNHGRGGDLLTTVADTIGISVADLQSAISSGSTIADIAAEHGSSGQKVIDALVAQLKAHFDPEVKSGEHTQAEVDQRIADFTTQITQFVNDTQNAAMGGPGMGGHGTGDGGNMGGGTIDAGPSDTVAAGDA